MKGWRTIVVNLLMLAIPLMESIEDAEIISPEYMPYFMVAWGMMNIGLRFITTTPVGKSK